MKSQLLGCLRKGSTTEATLAVRALGLHVLTLGLGPDTDRSAIFNPPLRQYRSDFCQVMLQSSICNLTATPVWSAQSDQASHESMHVTLAI